MKNYSCGAFIEQFGELTPTLSISNRGRIKRSSRPSAITIIERIKNTSVSCARYDIGDRPEVKVLLEHLGIRTPYTFLSIGSPFGEYIFL